MSVVDLVPVQYRVAAIAAGILLLVLLFAGALYSSYQHGVTVTDLRWQAKWSEQGELQAKAQAAATAANRTEEQRRQTAVNGVADDARKQEVAAAPGVAAASAAADRLRVDASKLVGAASGVPGDSGIAARSEANRRAAMVLSGLLDRAVERNRELAKGLDDARRRGLACERAYGALTPQPDPSIAQAWR